MPCMGPDYTFAKKQAAKVGNEMLTELISQYDLFQIDDPKYEKMFKLPGAVGKWKTAKENFLKSVEELFILDAGNSF